MATEKIDIVITEQGGARAAQNVAGVGNAAAQSQPKVENFNAAVSQLTSALALLGLALGTDKIIQLADQYDDIIDKLTLVSDSSKELIATESALFAVSQKTAGSLKANVSLYSELKKGTDDLNISNERLIGIIDTIGQALMIQGKSGDEAKGAINRLAASLAQGTVDGRGLNTVLLQFPELGRAIASGLGVGVGKLKELGQSGRLSSEMVINALEKVAPKITEQFNRIKELNVGEAMGNLREAIMRQVGIMDQAKGTTELLAKAIQFLANNMSTILPSLLAFMAGLTAFGILVGGASIAVGALWAILAAHPFALIASVLVIITQLIFAFGNQFKLTADGQITLLGVLIGSWRLLVEGVTAVYNVMMGYLVPAFQATVQWLTEMYNWVVNSPVALTVLAGGLGGVAVALAGMAIAASPVLLALTGLAAGFIGVYAAIQFFRGGAAQVKAEFERIKGIVIDTANSVTDNVGQKFGDAFRKASADTSKSGLAAKDWGEAWKKSSDDTLKVVRAGNTSMSDSMLDVGKASQAMAGDVSGSGNTVKNAMGQMVQVTDQWAAQTGALYNKVAGAADSMASSVETANNRASQSFSNMSTTASNNPFTGQTFNNGGIQGAGQGAFQSRTWNITPNEANGITQAGGDAGTLDALFRQSSRIGATEVDAANLKQFLRSQSSNAQAYLKDLGFKFKDGGDMVVGGSGGLDSQLVQFMASPGETVRVENRTQQIAGRNASGPTQVSAPVTVYMTVVTKDAESFRRTSDQTTQQLQGRLTRANRRGNQ